MTRAILSLTTIPPRMSQLGPTLDSLLRQTAKIEAILLWIPQRYRRAGFADFALPDLPAGVELRRCEADFGPATKVLPTIRAYRGQDVRILYCDDDRIYHPDWAQRMIDESDRFPEDCICEAGERVAVTQARAFGNTWRYQLYTKLSLGLYGHLHRRRIRALDPGHGLVDIAKGYGGVLVRPDFLTEAAFDIPDILWTVDDVWLSGQMALNGVKIRKITRQVHSTKTEVADVDALLDLVVAEQGRDAANLACIRYFQDRYGIWTDRGGRPTAGTVPAGGIRSAGSPALSSASHLPDR